MSIRTRLAKIQAQSKNIVELTPYKHHRRYALRSLTSDKPYQIDIEWLNTITADIEHLKVVCTCREVIGVGYCPDCKGNKVAVCKHALAALMGKAAEAGKELHLFDNFVQAFLYRNFGGQIIEIVSAQSDGRSWAVLKDKGSGGRILSDGTFQSDRERQQADLEEYHRVAGE